MNLPGFTATNSLAPSTANYYGGRSLAFASDEVQPEFLGVIKELGEHLVQGVEGGFHALSSGVIAGANAIGAAISKLNNTGGPGGKPFICGQWAMQMLSCTNGQPTYNQLQLATTCMQNNLTNPEAAVACQAITLSIYNLVAKACGEGGNPATLGPNICSGH